MGIWVTFDIEILDDPSFVALASANPEYPWRWMRIIQFAKRANEKGRVLRADGLPVTARDLALTHDRNTSTEELWRDLLATCVEEGLLIEEDGIYRVYDWRRWHRKPSDMPDAVAERVRRHRQNGGVTGRYVTPGNECNASEQSRAEQRQSRAEQQQSMRAHAREGLAAAAAADVAVAPEDDLGDELRPAIAQAMQALGILGSPSGTWWTSVTAWAAPAISSGATLDDVQDAIRYGAAKAAHDRPRRPWPYAMTIASEEIGQIARRNQMRRDWVATGRRGPEPLPYVWSPEEDTCSR
jgi:hypothetical protein